MVTLAVLAVSISIASFALSLPSFSTLLFIISGVVFVVFGIGRLFVKYKVKWSVGSEDIPIEFCLSWWRRAILLWIPPDWREIKAEVDYRYSELGWQHPSVVEWKEDVILGIPVTLGSYINVRGARDGYLITVFKTDSSGQKVTIHPDHQPLPNPFEYRISFLHNNKVFQELSRSYFTK